MGALKKVICFVSDSRLTFFMSMALFAYNASGETHGMLSVKLCQALGFAVEVFFEEMKCGSQ